MQIEFTVTQVRRTFLVCIFIIVAAHTTMLFMRYGLGFGRLKGLSAFVDLWGENNLPTFYASMSLLFCGLLLYLISLSEKKLGGKFAMYWLVMAALFIFLSADEMLQIHDSISEKLRVLGASGIFFHAWVIPYGIALVGLGIIYLRFLLSLTSETRNLFMMSALCYIGGALGFELLESIEFEKTHDRSLLMEIYVLIEETLEMVGVLIFIQALITELASRRVQVQFLAIPKSVEKSSSEKTVSKLN
jgi:hypothetical protein